MVGEEAWEIVLVDEVLVFEFDAIDWLSTGAVMFCDISTHCVLIWMNFVELTALEVEGLV